jgi:hypothetical protein
MAKFGVTYRTQIRVNWAIDWLRNRKDFNGEWDAQGDTLRQLYSKGENLSVHRCVFLMCGTTGELQDALDSAYGDGVRTFVEGSHGYLRVFDARRKIYTANKTVTVMKIFNVDQYYHTNDLKEQAEAHGWRLAEREGRRSITIADLRNHFVPAAKAAWG